MHSVAFNQLRQVGVILSVIYFYISLATALYLDLERTSASVMTATLTNAPTLNWVTRTGTLG